MATEQATQQHALPSPRIRPARSLAATTIAAGLGLVLLIIATYAGGGFSAIRMAYAYMRGETILVDSSTKSFGSAREGDRVSVSFGLTNGAGKPVRVVGCRAYCNCIVPDDLPFTINPHERRNLTLSVRIPERGRSSGTRQFSQPVTLYTTNAAQIEIPLLIEGAVQPPSSPTSSGS